MKETEKRRMLILYSENRETNRDTDRQDRARKERERGINEGERTDICS